METLKITPPQGYEIDKEKSTFEEIVFKPVKKKYPTKLDEINRPYFIANGAIKKWPKQYVEYFSSQERAEEVLALIQLLAFRDAVWEIDGWKPNWRDSQQKYQIYIRHNTIVATDFSLSETSILSFKTEETRDWFLETHRELIEKAKNLL